MKKENKWHVPSYEEKLKMLEDIHKEIKPPAEKEYEFDHNSSVDFKYIETFDIGKF